MAVVPGSEEPSREICQIWGYVVVMEEDIVVSVLGLVERENYGESFQGGQMGRLSADSEMEKDH